MPTPAVRTKDITFSYEGSEKLAVDKARLELEEGSYVALLGANGSVSAFKRLGRCLQTP